ncbi:Sigma-24, ECF subfamily [Candidatus Sulfotelmatomonas gaucii]|uniref:Sigma-24, ECF subfamily n=1 Tax=Candidatus Sulfuritelmatomonas gaucii TaxID=2043161 RepID=A0A2N9LPT1_9BACT|nr:Sigma-24, ECF subfamily [Candidatus Sulfotelmatomonas gaucii]
METIDILKTAVAERWSDLEVIDRVKAGETALYEIIMRRYNQRLYRVARAILRDDAEAEDVMQDAYVRAYQHLYQYAGEAHFSIWLTRIAVNEALHRLRLRKRSQQLEDMEQEEEGTMSGAETSPDPEHRASIAELGRLLEEAVLGLPDQYRAVVMMRDVEEMTTAETAAALDLTEQNVRVRLHRGHAMMRGSIFARAGAISGNAFPFMAVRCDRVVFGVFARLGEAGSSLE